MSNLDNAPNSTDDKNIFDLEGGVDPDSLTDEEIMAFDGVMVSSKDRDLYAPYDYSELGEYREFGGTGYERQETNPTDKLVFKAYQKEGLLSRPVNKINQKYWDKGFKVLTPGKPDSKLPEETNDFFKKFQIISKLCQGTTSRTLFGAGWLWYQTKDIESPEDLKTELDINANIKLYKIVTLPKLLLVEPIRDTTTGAIKWIRFMMNDGTNDNAEIDIHVSRLLPIINDPLGIHPMGQSEVLAAITRLSDLQTIIWSMQQILKTRAAPVTIIYFPRGMIKKHRRQIMAQFKNLQPNDIVGIQHAGQTPDDKVKVEWPTSFTAMGNMAPNLSIIMDVYAASIGMPKVILFSMLEASSGGSDTNVKEWLSDISATQQMKHTNYIEQLITLGRACGEIKCNDKYNIKWNPLYEIDHRELNIIHLNESVTGLNYEQIGYEVVIDDMGLIDYNKTKKVRESVASLSAEKPKERAPEIRNPGTEAQALAPDEGTSSLVGSSDSQSQSLVVSLTNRIQQLEDILSNILRSSKKNKQSVINLQDSVDELFTLGERESQ